jgi:hypothetical protein
VFDVRVMFSKRHPRARSWAYFASTDLARSVVETLRGYGGRWSCEVVNFYTKTQLGLADFRVRSYEAVERYVVAVHLAWAYVDERFARERSLDDSLHQCAGNGEGHAATMGVRLFPVGLDDGVVGARQRDVRAQQPAAELVIYGPRDLPRLPARQALNVEIGGTHRARPVLRCSMRSAIAASSSADMRLSAWSPARRTSPLFKSTPTRAYVICISRISR